MVDELAEIGVTGRNRRILLSIQFIRFRWDGCWIGELVFSHHRRSQLPEGGFCLDRRIAVFRGRQSTKHTAETPFE